MALQTSNIFSGQDQEGLDASNKAKALRDAAKAKSIERGSSIGTGIGTGVGALAGIIATVLTAGSAAPTIGPAMALGGQIGGQVGKVAKGGSIGVDPQAAVNASQQADKLYNAFKAAKTQDLGLAKMSGEELAKYVAANPEIVKSTEYLSLFGEDFVGPLQGAIQ